MIPFVIATLVAGLEVERPSLSDSCLTSVEYQMHSFEPKSEHRILKSKPTYDYGMYLGGTMVIPCPDIEILPIEIEPKFAGDRIDVVAKFVPTRIVRVMATISRTSKFDPKVVV